MSVLKSGVPGVAIGGGGGDDDDDAIVRIKLVESMRWLRGFRKAGGEKNEKDGEGKGVRLGCGLQCHYLRFNKE